MTHHQGQPFGISLISLSPSAHPILVPFREKKNFGKYEERKQAGEEDHLAAPALRAGLWRKHETHCGHQTCSSADPASPSHFKRDRPHA